MRHWYVLKESWKRRKQLDHEQRFSHEIEFLPAALELQHTPPSPVGRAISYIVISFFVVAVVWACIGHVDIVSVAQGKIIPSGKSKIIQPIELGKVTKIHVKEGQHVKKGDLLLELDITSMTADVERLHAELNTYRASHARTVALIETLNKKAASPGVYYKPEENIPQHIIQSQRDSLISQYDEYLSQKQALLKELERKRAEYNVTKDNITKLEQVLPLVTERADSLYDLSIKNLVARNDYMQIEQERIEITQDLAAFKNQSVEAKQAIEQVKAQLKTLTAQIKKNTYQEKAQLEIQISNIEKELVKAEIRENFQRITAPVDGVVQQLAIHTVGGVVTPAQELMVIVPKDQQLEAEVYIQNKDIGFVEEKQIAEIKVDAFPFTKYGTIDGEILNISNDAVENENLGWVFLSRVSLEANKIKVREKLVNLTPGMSVTVEVKTGKRRLIEFFLSPLLRYKQESIKER